MRLVEEGLLFCRVLACHEVSGAKAKVGAIWQQVCRNGFVSSATAVPYTLSRTNNGGNRTISMGTMIYVGTAVTNPRKSVQSVAKKDDNEFE